MFGDFFDSNTYKSMGEDEIYKSEVDYYHQHTVIWKEPRLLDTSELECRNRL